MLSFALLEKSLKTEIYCCGGTYKYIDGPLEKALPPLPRYAQAGFGYFIAQVAFFILILPSSCISAHASAQNCPTSLLKIPVLFSICTHGEGVMKLQIPFRNFAFFRLFSS